jgi:hypothetical protein
MDTSSTTHSVLSVIQSKLTYLYKLPNGIGKLIEGTVEKKHAKERLALECNLKDTINSMRQRLARIKYTIYEEIMNFSYVHSKLTYYNECLTSFEDNLKETSEVLDELAKNHCLLFK